MIFYFQQSKGTIRFFDVHGDGESFVVYNEDARFTAREALKSNAGFRTCKYRDGKEDKTLEYGFIKRNTVCIL
jgi:hypothetical protein